MTHELRVAPSRPWLRLNRGFLVACNLLLLSAAMPAAGHPSTSTKPAGGSSVGPKPKPGRTVQKRNEHKSSGKVRPSPPATNKATNDSSSSSDDDDDDDGGDAAGEILGACCVGMVGAIADGAANDPTDVERPEPEPMPPQEPLPPWQPEPSGEESPQSDVFDAQAAESAIQQALRDVREQCETRQEALGDHELTMTFHPEGYATSALLDPPPASERLDKCATAAFLRARVPAFTDNEVRVRRSIRKRGGSSDSSDSSGSSGSSGGSGGTGGSQAN